MALRAGAQTGPAKLIDYVGIAAAILAPISLLLYVVIAGAAVDDRRGVEAAQALQAELKRSGCVWYAADTCTDLVNASDEVRAAVVTDVLGVEDPDASPLDRSRIADLRAERDLLESTLDLYIERNTYSHISHTISRLGDRGDGIGWGFSFVNYFGALCLVLFAIAVYRRLPVSEAVVVMLGVAAVATVMIGKFRCQEGCPIGLDDGAPITSDTVVHYTGALTVIALMVLIPRAAWWTLPIAGRSAPLRRLSRIASNLALLGALVLAASVIVTGWLEDEVDAPWVDVNAPTWMEHGVVGLGERITWAFGYIWIVATAVVMFLQRRGVEQRAFDVTNIQRGMLYGSPSWSESAYLPAVISDPAEFRTELRTALDSGLIQGEERRPRPLVSTRPPFTVAVAFSRAGLQRLGVGYRRDLPGDDPFEVGMAARWEILGDTGDSRPESWDDEWEGVHVLFWIQASTGERSGAVSRVRGCFPHGVEFRRVTNGDRLGTADAPRERFGFVDGISQPWIERIHRADDVSRAGGGKLTPKGWEQIALGEFVLGEVDEADDESPVPEPQELFRHGSFMVVRKLQQDRGSFEDLLRPAPESELDEQLAAAMVGRHRDGRPLATVFESGGAAGAAGGGYLERNLFVFGDDPEGFGCPLGAHVRRANPRDALGFGGRSVHRRRIIRRGMPYAEGLMFVAFNSRIEGQFEFIQQQWLNDGAPFRLGNDPDVIAGSWEGARRFVRQGETPTVIELPRPLVTMKGGEYFVLPALSGLRFLVG